jgi:hypothetical protein
LRERAAFDLRRAHGPQLTLLAAGKSPRLEASLCLSPERMRRSGQRDSTKLEGSRPASRSCDPKSGYHPVYAGFRRRSGASRAGDREIKRKPTKKGGLLRRQSWTGQSRKGQVATTYPPAYPPHHELSFAEGET